MSGLKVRLSNIERAIAERRKVLEALEASNDPEAILRRASLKREIEVLEGEKKILEAELRRLEQSYRERLPTLEQQYLGLASKQKILLRKAAERCEELLDVIEQLQKNIHALDIVFPQYRDACWALQLTPKDIHVREIYPLVQARRWLTAYLEWLGKTRHAVA